MRKLALIIVLLMAAPLAAQTVGDAWEPNGTVALAKDIYNHIGENAFIAGIDVAIPQAQLPARPVATVLDIRSTDIDWFRVGGFLAVPSGTMNVFLHQRTALNFPLQIQIYNETGTTVLAGPTVGTYQQLTAPPAGPDLYDGARVQASVTAGTIYLLRVSSPTTIPSPNIAEYEISIEFAPTDTAEGAYSNNFPGVAPGGPGHPSDATPTGVGAGNAKTYTSVSWRGMDYYMVRLTSPGTITVTLDGFANQPAPTTNLDVYWINMDGVLLPASAPDQPLAGAEDSFPLGRAAGFAQVMTPNTSEQIVTPGLAPGDYYFHVWAWDTSGGGIGVMYDAGNYDISFVINNMSDDALEGGATQNDTAPNATTLPSGQTSNLRLLFNGDGLEEDWYKVSVPDGGNLNVRMNLTTPDTDDLNIRLYQPNTTSPGDAADLIDSSLIPNPDVGTKGAPTGSEIVGTWGTVGNSGNTGLPAGDYLVRITSGTNAWFGGVPLGQMYSLVVTISGSNVNVAPDDAREPNDTVAQAALASNTHLVLPRGLTTGLKSMDFHDWYRVTGISNGADVEISLIYDGNASTDLDIIVFDINGGEDFATDGVLAALTSNFANENTPSSVASAVGVAGTTHTTNPGSGPIYIVVQRWNSHGARYSINVNINNADPLPTLRANTISCNPTTVAAPGSTQVTVAVQNTGGAAADVTALDLKLTHAGGAPVTGEYTITGPNPALPVSIPAAGTQNFTFSVQSDNQCTNGVITATVEGQDGNAEPLLGDPSATFTLSGGIPPGPRLVYANVNAGGLLYPGGTMSLSVSVRNEGTAGGDFDHTPPLTFAFDQGGANVSAMFGTPSQPSVALPLSIAAAETRVISWNFTISDTIPLGATRVVISGGGPENPTTQGTATFNIGLKATPRSGGGGCAIGGLALPIAPMLAMLAALAVRRRRQE